MTSKGTRVPRQVGGGPEECTVSADAPEEGVVNGWESYRQILRELTPDPRADEAAFFAAWMSSFPDGIASVEELKTLCNERGLLKAWRLSSTPRAEHNRLRTFLRIHARRDVHGYAFREIESTRRRPGGPRFQLEIVPRPAKRNRPTGTARIPPSSHVQESRSAEKATTGRSTCARRSERQVRDSGTDSPNRERDRHQAWFTVSEIARHLRVHEDTIRRAIQKGNLKALTIGRRVRLRREWVETWLAANTSTTADERVQQSRGKLMSVRAPRLVDDRERAEAAAAKLGWTKD